MENLHSTVEELQKRLAACKDGSAYDQPTDEPSTHPPPATLGRSTAPDVTKEAEEVGVLAIGFGDRYSQAKYGK